MNSQAKKYPIQLAVACILVLIGLVLVALQFFQSETEPQPSMTVSQQNPAELPAAPVANRVPHNFSYHGIEVEDPYHWLKDQGYPEVDDQAVLSYLNEENAYFEAYFEPLQQQVETIFSELKGR